MRCKTKQEEDSRFANASKKFGADLRIVAPRCVENAVGVEEIR